jgi:hypothetical protein
MNWHSGFAHGAVNQWHDLHSSLEWQLNKMNARHRSAGIATPGSGLLCHRSLENQPVGVESKPATLRRFVHIRFLDPGKGLFDFFMSADRAPRHSVERLARSHFGLVCDLYSRSSGSQNRQPTK